MAKPGDVVEFKGGLFGIEPPRNLAILLARRRVKGVPMVRLLTLDGEKEAKAEHLSRRLFKQRYEGDVSDTQQAMARLRHLATQHAGGGLAEEPEDDLDRLEEQLWEATCDDGRESWTEADIAAALFGPPSPGQLRDVRAALARCRRPGTGRFQPAGRGDLWRPWSREEERRIQKGWQALQALRTRLVEQHEDAEGIRTFRGRPIAEAGLSEADRATLVWVKAAMVQFVDWDGVPEGEPVAGIAGLGATQAFGHDLHRQLGFLAQDWIGTEHTNRSSDYIQFLVGTGLWSPQDAVDGLIRRHVNQEEFFEHVTDERAEAEAQPFADPDLAQDPGRKDLRGIPCYTIDPPDAKDFDDAVGLETTPAGATRLWVHVADVSQYVTLDSYLDRHAKRRATSVYLPGRVLPMLPHRLSDHLCSLRSDGDRFALSVGLDLDADGRVTAAQFHKAVIRVTENLSYATALERAAAGHATFQRLLAVAALMRQHRHGMELETGELKVLLGAAGFSALEKRADDATRMIETFMVAANEAVARHLADTGVPQLYRCHPLPDRQKATRLGHQLATMGIPVTIDLPATKGTGLGGGAPGESILDQLRRGGGKLNLFGGGLSITSPADAAPTAPGAPDASGKPDAVAPPPGFAQLDPLEREAWLRPFRDAVDAIAQHPDEARAEVATLKVLAAMGRAYYTPDNQGHFGLASMHYGHFTSPIRRYPDLVVHRNLKWLLDGRSGAPPHSQESLRALCDHCSNQERAADQLERRVKASCLVLATLGHADASGAAVEAADAAGSATGDAAADASAGAARVTGITPASLFVQLAGGPGDGIEARIPARDLPGGPYQCDEWESMLFMTPQGSGMEDDRRARVEDVTDWFDPDSGELRKVRVRLGDKVSVRLAGRDIAAGRTGAQLLQWR